MKRIIKIAENNVEVQTVYFDEKVNGKEIIFARKGYNQFKIDNEIKAANYNKTALDILNIADKKAKEDAKLTELALIQTEMNK